MNIFSDNLYSEHSIRSDKFTTFFNTDLLPEMHEWTFQIK